MMLLSILFLIISCFIQGVMSSYLGYIYSNLSLFSTIYVLIALLVLRPYFEEEKKYLVLLVVFGLIMDITTNTFILNTSIFLVIYYFTRVFHFFFPYNAFTINISNILGIFLYHTMTFLFLFLLQYDSYSVSVLFKVLTHSVVMTILYTTISYGLIKFLVQKFSLKKVK